MGSIPSFAIVERSLVPHAYAMPKHAQVRVGQTRLANEALGVFEKKKKKKYYYHIITQLVQCLLNGTTLSTWPIGLWRRATIQTLNDIMHLINFHAKMKPGEKIKCDLSIAKPVGSAKMHHA